MWGGGEEVGPSVAPAGRAGPGRRGEAPVACHPQKAAILEECVAFGPGHGRPIQEGQLSLLSALHMCGEAAVHEARAGLCGGVEAPSLADSGFAEGLGVSQSGDDRVGQEKREIIRALCPAQASFLIYKCAGLTLMGIA